MIELSPATYSALVFALGVLVGILLSIGAYVAGTK
jgi:hypothetical protein